MRIVLIVAIGLVGIVAARAQVTDAEIESKLRVCDVRGSHPKGTPDKETKELMEACEDLRQERAKRNDAKLAPSLKRDFDAVKELAKKLKQ